MVLEHPLRRQRRGDDDLLLLDLADPLGDQLRLDRLAVDLLHLARGDLLGQRGDPLELLLGVLVAREDALEVEHREAAEAADRSPAVSGETTPSIAEAIIGSSNW